MTVSIGLGRVRSIFFACSGLGWVTQNGPMDNSDTDYVDLQRTKIFLGNIVRQFTNAVSDDLTILPVNRTQEKSSSSVRCFEN